MIKFEMHIFTLSSVPHANLCSVTLKANNLLLTAEIWPKLFTVWRPSTILNCLIFLFFNALIVVTIPIFVKSGWFFSEFADIASFPFCIFVHRAVCRPPHVYRWDGQANVISSWLSCHWSAETDWFSAIVPWAWSSADSCLDSVSVCMGHAVSAKQRCGASRHCVASRQPRGAIFTASVSASVST